MYANLVNKHPFNEEYRKEFYSYRSRYRRRCKFEEREYEEKICKELCDSVDTNPKYFWNLINKLDQSSKYMTNETLPHDIFKDHFEKLTLDRCDANSFQQEITRKFDSLNTDSVQNTFTHNLNGEISQDEIVKAIKSLKKGKSASVDFISNEMLKMVPKKS